MKVYSQILDHCESGNDTKGLGVWNQDNLLFLNEIIQDIIKLKIKNLSNPKSNEFSNRLKQIVGKSFGEGEFKELISSKDDEIKEKIIVETKRKRKAKGA